jgi:uncharacterized protein involved in copper resistance
MDINNNQQKEKNMKTIINTVLAITVLTLSANSAARWHNAPKDGGSNHAHSMNMDGMDHSKMSTSEHAMKDMDHSNMSASELLKMNMKDMDHSTMKDEDHHQENTHGH